MEKYVSEEEQKRIEEENRLAEERRIAEMARKIKTYRVFITTYPFT